MERITHSTSSTIVQQIRQHRRQGQASTGMLLSGGPVLVRDRNDPNELFNVAGPSYLGNDVGFVVPESLLSGETLWAIYRSSPDVRASVETIARRVSTWDSETTTIIPPTSDRYGDALVQAAAVERFMNAPNDEDTQQTFLFAWTVDALVFWHGAAEVVFEGTKKVDPNLMAGPRSPIRRQGVIYELVNVYSPTVFARRSKETQRIDGWVQDPLYAAKPHWASVADRDKRISLEKRQIVRIQVAPNSRSPYSVPIIETIVKEAALLVRGSERALQETDVGQLVPGILVITGGNPKVMNDVEMGLEQNGGNPWRITALHTPGATNPVHWVELKRTFQEIEYLPLSKEARRTIYRNFGVSPVEMGDLENTNRATAAVELEVSSSALIEPLLEMIEQVINRHIVPLIVEKIQGPDAPVLCEWRFDRTVKRSPAEDLDAARADDIRLKSGQRSINELRQRDGLPRIEGGDTYRIEDIPIGDEVVDPDPDEPTDPDGGDESEVNQDDVDTIDEGQDEDESERTRTTLAGIAELLMRQGDPIRDDHLPSAWQSPGIFDGLRTVNLRALADEIAGYTEDIVPVWDRMMRDLEAAARFAESRGLLGGAQHLSQNAIIFAELREDWERITLRRYEAVAEIGRRAAADIAGPAAGTSAESDADVYYARAMVFLDDLIEDVSQRVTANINAASIGRVKTTAEDDIDGDSSIDDVVTAIGASVAANTHRITNWAGRLVELVYLVVRGRLRDNPPETAPGDAGVPIDPDDQATGGSPEWWYVWHAVHDRGTCEVCEDEGNQPPRPVSQMTVTPGGDTICQANCRCVVSIWLPSEIAAGEHVI